MGSQFDEVEALQLIPVIIDQAEDRRISETDQAALAKVYGPIWKLITDEADRRRNRKREPHTLMDGVLRAILRAQENKKYSNQHALNRRSSADSATSKGFEPFASHLAINWDKKNRKVEPSQRILRMAAVLIQEQQLDRQIEMLVNRPRKLSRRLAKMLREVKLQRRLVKEKEAIAAAKPILFHKRQRRSIDGLDDELNGDQMQMLRSLMSTGSDEEYDYDYENDNDLGDGEQVDEPQREMEEEEDDNSSDYDGYALDMTQVMVEDDDALLRRMYGAPRPMPKKQISVLELFRLAAQHQRRAERDSKHNQYD